MLLCSRRKASRGHGPEASRKSRLSRAARETTTVNKQTDGKEVDFFSCMSQPGACANLAVWLKIFNCCHYYSLNLFWLPFLVQESKTKANGTKDNSILDRTKVNGDARLFSDIQPVSVAQVKERSRHVKNDSREEIPFSGPLIVSSSSGFAWAKKPPEDRSFARSRTRSSSRGQFTAELDQDNKMPAKENQNLGLKEQPNRDMHIARANSKVREPHDAAKRAVLKKWSQLGRPDSFDSYDTYHSQNFSNAMYLGDSLSSKNSIKVRHLHI